MFLDIGVGIIATYILSHFFAVEMDLYTVFIGVAFTLIPDVDFFPHLLLNKSFNATKRSIHRELTHYPILHLPIAALVFVLFGNFYGTLYFVCVLLHFVHDSLWTGWGIKWLWPFNRRNYKFFSDKAGRVSANFVVSWDPQELKAVEQEHGDKDWFKHLYLRPSRVVITELAFLIIGLIVLILAI